MLQISDLTVRYGEHTVLDSLNADFPGGTATGVIGENGAGKTTLFSAVVGRTPIESGRFLLDSIPVYPTRPDWKRRVALIPDDNALFDDLSPDEHFELLGTLFRIPRSESTLRRTRLEEIFGLDRFSTAPAGKLSFGYRKRLAISIALYRDAGIYLFDEPFSGLDAASLGVFRRVIDLLAEARRVVVIASHAHALLRSVCDRTLILGSGKLSHDPDANDEATALHDWNIPWVSRGDR